MKILQQIKRLSLATVIIGFISGILFISYPEQCIKYVSLSVGIALIGLSVAGIIGYFLDKTSTFSLVMGIILGIIGIVVCLRYKQVISFIVAVIGIFIICAGVVNLVTGLKVISRSIVFGWITLFMSVATIVFGVIAILNAAALSETLVRIIGVGLIIYSVLDLIAYFEVRSIAKEVKQAVDSVSDVETEGTIVSEGDDIVIEQIEE